MSTWSNRSRARVTLPTAAIGQYLLGGLKSRLLWQRQNSFCRSIAFLTDPRKDSIGRSDKLAAMARSDPHPSTRSPSLTASTMTQSLDEVEDAVKTVTLVTMLSCCQQICRDRPAYISHTFNASRTLKLVSTVFIQN